MADTKTIAPHNQQLRTRLTGIIGQLEMARDDAEDEFHGAIAHAEIALDNLRRLIEHAKSTRG